MKVANRNRYIKGNSSGSGNGGTGGVISTHAEVITLTQFFDILLIIDEKTIRIDTDQQALFPTGQIVVIDGSSDGEATGVNDGLYEVASTLVVPGSGEMNVIFTEGNLATGLSEDGVAHIAKDKDVRHNLDTEDIIYRMKNIATGTMAVIDDDSSDNNKLILKPGVPLLGNFRITVFAKK